MSDLKYNIGRDVMLMTGKYTSYIATLKSVSNCGMFAYVELDLSPERIIRKLRFRINNVMLYTE